VKCLDFSPGSNDFVVTGADGTMRHIDAGTGKTLFQVSTNETINAVRTDGYTVLGVGEHGVVRGWNLRGAEEIIKIPTQGGNQLALAVNEDASFFCVANQKALLYQHQS
jgi:WD40 repeat protein